MYCQHKQSIDYKTKGIKSSLKKKPNPLMGELRNKNKKTQLPSTLILKLQEPTRKELSSDKKTFIYHIKPSCN